MTLIDKYIAENHYTQSISTIAKTLGIPETMVSSRVLALDRLANSLDGPSNPQQEMAALINLIHTRKQGWAVDVAKQRLYTLEKNALYYYSVAGTNFS